LILLKNTLKFKPLI